MTRAPSLGNILLYNPELLKGIKDHTIQSLFERLRNPQPFNPDPNFSLRYDPNYEDIMSDDDTTTVNETPTAPVSPAEKKQLFAAYKEAKAVHEKKTAEMEAAYKALSDSVAAIAKKCGVGPFKFDGQTLKIISRKSKNSKNGKDDDSGEKTYFFRGASEKVDVID